MREDHIPITLGKLKQVNGRYLLTASLGNAIFLNEIEAALVDDMEGFATLQELAKKHNIQYTTAQTLFERLKTHGYVSDLCVWNLLRWCERCGGYIVSQAERCPNCEEETRQVPIKTPCDAWILMGEDFDFVQEVLDNQFGKKLSDEDLVLGNWGLEDTTTFWEIIYEGQIILSVIFKGERRDTWEYVPTIHLESADFSPRGASFEEQIDRLIELNARRLVEVKEESMAIIESTVGLFPSLPLVYFSGGKESIIMSEMFRLLEKECNLLLVLPGMDQPDDVDFFNREMVPYLEAVPYFHHHVYEQDPELFFELAERKGRLSAKDPWCRTELKMPLKHAATRAIYGDQYFVAYEGSRKYETNYRRRYGIVNIPDNYDQQIWVHPIAHWTGLDLWLYIYKNDLKINPIYKKGFQKTTCWCCPLVQPFHLERSKSHYPELWQRLDKLELVGFSDRDQTDIPF